MVTEVKVLSATRKSMPVGPGSGVYFSQPICFIVFAVDFALNSRGHLKNPYMGKITHPFMLADPGINYWLLTWIFIITMWQTCIPTYIFLIQIN